MATMYPLLDSQLGVLLACSSSPHSTSWNLPSVLLFDKTISADQLAEATQSICAARAELHLCFVRTEDGELRQYTDPTMSIPIARKSLTDKEADLYIREEFVQPFAPFAHEPLCRFEVVETPTRVMLLMDFHHSIADGYTIAGRLTGSDLPAAYAHQALPAPRMTLMEWAAHEHEAQQSPAYAQAKAYYQKLFGDSEATHLSPALPDTWGKRLDTSFPVPIPTIEEWCAAHHTSAYHLLMAAFSLTLAKLSHQEKVTFSTLYHGRYDKRLKETYGMFVNTIPFIVDIDAGMTTDQLLTQIRRRLMGSIRHRTYPYTHFCHDTGIIPRITFGFQSDGILEQVVIGDTRFKGIQLKNSHTPNDLSVMVYNTDDTFDIRLEASDALYSPDDLERFATAMRHCLNEMMRDDLQPVRHIELTDKRQRAQLLQLSAGEKTDADSDQTFVSLFLSQAARTPSRLAVDDTLHALTYNQLEQQSRTLAHWLAAEGAGHGHLIGLAAVPCTEFLIGALAIMRSGNAYVPIDPHLPLERRRHIISDSGISIVLDAQGIRAHATTPPPPQPIDHSVAPGAAYVVYTSGSSGAPKGVVVRHAGLTNLIHFCVRRWPLTSDSRIACHSSLAFDASVEDLFPVLTVGGCVMPVAEDIRTDLDALARFLSRHHITGGCYTTSLGVALAQAHPIEVDYFCVGGERLHTVPSVKGRVYNTYGPTEFTVDATYCELEKDKTYPVIPIGRPVDNCHSFVVDPFGCLLPRGATGELWLAGPQLAAGYLNDPVLTAERFTRCRFHDGYVYHTGDLARWNDQGQLEFVGRKDNQVKIDGIRISLEEIEQRLLDIPSVSHAAVVAMNDNVTTQLHAYYTATSPKLTEQEITDRLKLSLPPQMIPTRYIQLAEMPLTPSGKTDRRRLPLQHSTAIPAEPPVNSIEEILCSLFEQMLNEARIGATDDFFDMGGTSILAMRLVTEARRKGLELAYGDIFSHPTPRRLATLLKDSSRHSAYTAEDYDYHNIEQWLSQKHDGGKKERLTGGTLLLTGGTGFLGIHLLRRFLAAKTWDVVCLMRDTDEHQARKRLLDRWAYYFGDEPTHPDKIHIVYGDLAQGTDIPVFSETPLKPDLVINCAADVRYFAKDDNIGQVNTRGTEQLARYCLESGTPMVQISTLSVDGITPPDHDTAAARQQFYHRQRFADQYSYSKFLAERLLLEKMSTEGLDATIIRIGFLGPASNGGQLPFRHSGNLLWVALEALSELGCPESAQDLFIDWAPVDKMAALIYEHSLVSPFRPILELKGEGHVSLQTLAERHAGRPLHRMANETFQALLSRHPQSVLLSQAFNTLASWKVEKSDSQF